MYHKIDVKPKKSEIYLDRAMLDPIQYIPLSIFFNDELSALETIVKYFKEDVHLSFRVIGYILNRNERTIWATYNKSQKKRKLRLSLQSTVIYIPVEKISSRKLSVLESIVVYLKDHYRISFSEIARLLRKDSRNIWAVYKKGKNR